MKLRSSAAVLVGLHIIVAAGACFGFLALALGVSGSGSNADLEVAIGALGVAAMLLVPGFALSCWALKRPNLNLLVVAIACLAPAALFEVWLVIQLVS